MGSLRRMQATAAVVLRALERALAADASATFLTRRARVELATAANSGDASADEPYLRRLLVLACASDPAVHHARIVGQLVAYACHLESTNRVSEALAAVDLALRVTPSDPATMLHAARLSRKAGDAPRARDLYAAVSVAREVPHLARLATIGAALVDADRAALARAIRTALRAGDAEAAAVGLEERAALRRRSGEHAAAARDLAVAALRYPDASDRGRAASLLADLLVGDPVSTREALLGAAIAGKEAQRHTAQARLGALSRRTGDRLGIRRWRSSTPALVSLTPSGSVASSEQRAASSDLRRLRRWRTLLEARSGSASLAVARAPMVPLRPAAARLEG